MKLKLTQIIGLLLLPAFLAVSIGSVPGYAWCFGEDGHSEIEEATITGCSDNQIEPKEFVKYDTPSLHASENGHCGSCLDFSAQQSETVFSKRHKKILQTPTDAIILNVFPQNFVKNVKLVACNLASQPPPRISQTILAHRTVVLLN